ncbi:MAG: hypothetical protein HRT71_16270 [Flavobacteriales bacterium]|nr:hypothetical protein [Flavobacteriales bacterium]
MKLNWYKWPGINSEKDFFDKFQEIQNIEDGKERWAQLRALGINQTDDQFEKGWQMRTVNLDLHEWMTDIFRSWGKHNGKDAFNFIYDAKNTFGFELPRQCLLRVMWDWANQDYDPALKRARELTNMKLRTEAIAGISEGWGMKGKEEEMKSLFPEIDSDELKEEILGYYRRSQGNGEGQKDPPISEQIAEVIALGFDKPKFMESLKGTYMPAAGKYIFTYEDGVLKNEIPGDQVYIMKPISETEFTYVTWPNWSIKFTVDESGTEVIRIEEHSPDGIAVIFPEGEWESKYRDYVESLDLTAPDTKVLIYRDQHSWARNQTFEETFDYLGIAYDAKPSAFMSETDLSKYDMILIPGAQWNTTEYYKAFEANIAMFDKFVKNGGTLVVELNGTEKYGITLPGGAMMNKHLGYINLVTIPSHPIFAPMRGELQIKANLASHGYLTNVPAGAMVLASVSKDGESADMDKPTFVEYNHGKGRVIAGAQCFHNQDNSGRGPLMATLLVYAANKQWLPESKVPSTAFVK